MRKMRKSGSFRHSLWDPILLFSQIIAVQSVMYLTLSILIAIAEDLTGASRTLDHMFQYHEIHILNHEGIAVIVAFVLNSTIGAAVLWLVVGRTKLCLDFSCTYHLLHLIACWLYNGAFPTTFSWWSLNVACGAISCLGGEWLCLRTEMRAIPLGMGKVDL